ncbi:helix-turn-helix domain-containing protein [Streptomyces sp. NPDC001970]
MADGDPQALRGTAGLVRRHHELHVAPYWTHIRAQFEEERSTAVRVLLQSGFAAMAQGLHPSIRWMPPVLEVGGPHLDGDLHLNGRGLRIVPSFFCWPGPIVLRDRTLPPVLVHPLTHDPRWPAPSAYGGEDRGRGSGGGSPHRALAALLGRARAAVLEAVADGLSTTELSRRAGISPATVSHHTAVLREAGLIASRRLGGAVLHTLTPMGAELLGGPPISRIGPLSKGVVHADSRERG